MQTPGTVDAKDQKEVAIGGTEFVALDSDENEVCWSKLLGLFANHIIVIACDKN